MERGKVLILSDSNGRHMFSLLHHSLQGQYNVFSFIKPNAKLKDVVDSVDGLTCNFNRRDYVLIIGGTNDVSGDAKYQTTIPEALDTLMPVSRKTNLIVTEIPRNYFHKMYKIIREANKFIRNAINIKNRTLPNNVDFMRLEKMLKRCDFTRHGLHMNIKGKMKVASAFASFIIGMKEPQFEIPPIKIKYETKQRSLGPEKSEVKNSRKSKRSNRRKRYKNENKCLIIDEPVVPCKNGQRNRAYEKVKCSNKTTEKVMKGKSKSSTTPKTMSPTVKNKSECTEVKKVISKNVLVQPIVPLKQVNTELNNNQKNVDTLSTQVMTYESNLTSDIKNNIPDNSENKNESVKYPVAPEIISHSAISSKSNPDIHSNEYVDTSDRFKIKINVENSEKYHNLPLIKSCPEISIDHKVENVIATEITSDNSGILDAFNIDAHKTNHSKINEMFGAYQTEFDDIKSIDKLTANDVQEIEKLVIGEETQKDYDLTAETINSRVDIETENCIKEILNAIITVISVSENIGSSTGISVKQKNIEIENGRIDGDNVVYEVESEFNNGNDDTPVEFENVNKTYNNSEKSLTRDETKLNHVNVTTFEKINPDVANIEINIKENNDEREHIKNEYSVVQSVESDCNMITDVKKFIENIIFESGIEVTKREKFTSKSDSCVAMSKINNPYFNVIENKISNIQTEKNETESQGIENISSFEERNIERFDNGGKVISSENNSIYNNVEIKKNFVKMEEITNTDSDILEHKISKNENDVSKNINTDLNYIDNTNNDIHLEVIVTLSDATEGSTFSDDKTIENNEFEIKTSEKINTVKEPDSIKNKGFHEDVNIERNNKNLTKIIKSEIKNSEYVENENDTRRKITTDVIDIDNMNNDINVDLIFTLSDATEGSRFSDAKTIKRIEFENENELSEKINNEINCNETINNDIEMEKNIITIPDAKINTLFKEETLKPTEFKTENVVITYEDIINTEVKYFENKKKYSETANDSDTGPDAMESNGIGKNENIEINYENVSNIITSEVNNSEYIENEINEKSEKVIVGSDALQNSKFSKVLIIEVIESENQDAVTHYKNINSEFCNNNKNGTIMDEIVRTEEDTLEKCNPDNKFTDVVEFDKEYQITTFKNTDRQVNYIENLNKDIKLKIIITLPDVLENSKLPEDKTIRAIEFEKINNTSFEQNNFQSNNVGNANKIIKTNSIINEHDSTDNSKSSDDKTIKAIENGNEVITAIINTNYIENKDDGIKMNKVTSLETLNYRALSDENIIKTAEFENNDKITCKTVNSGLNDLENKDYSEKTINEIEFKRDASRIEKLVTKGLFESDFVISLEKTTHRVNYIENDNTNIENVVNMKMSKSKDIEVLNKTNSQLCKIENHFKIYKLINMYKMGSLFNSFTNDEALDFLIEFKDENKLLKLKKMLTKDFV